MLVRYQTFPSLFQDIEDLLIAPVPVLHHRFQKANPVYGVAMKDSGDTVNVAVELPGVSKDDVKVTVHENALTIKAERKQPELKNGETWIRNEISYGKFERTVNLPYPIVTEKVSAVHENGILNITLPKADEAKPKQIVIR
jgi:HSP20 family protein